MTNIEPKASPQRLMSLDALRGFDMFWIMGADEVLHGLYALTGWWIFQPILKQLQHVAWNGFHAEDLIFPLFLFLAGVAMPFSLGRRIEEGTAKWKLALKVIRRGLLLVLLGLIYNGLLQTGFTAQLRWGSVLGRIGLAYLFAGLIFLAVGVRGQAISIAVVLLGYWAAMMLVPVPSVGAGNLERGKNLADYIDQRILPGKLYQNDHDPEGLPSTVPAIATALLGALAGHWLRRGRASGSEKSAGLIAAGLAALALGWAWDKSFPINKHLWSSSFVMWTAGWSLLLLGTFYQVIDVWKLRRWAFFFVVIGANAITIYMATRFVNFHGITALIFPLHGSIHEHLRPILIVAVEWFCLFVMYRNRWFLRI